MPRLVGKINCEARENRVHRFDPSEPPTAMYAETAVCQSHQRFDVAAFDFSGRRQFLKFLSHNHISLAPRNGRDTIKDCERTKTKRNRGASFAAARSRGRLCRASSRKRAGPVAACTGRPRALPGNRLWRRPLAGAARLAHRPKDKRTHAKSDASKSAPA